jgi:cellulose synthase/poly-beta-1,6-N-acetylglucosamine synthase-like glycosyltransferase
MDVVAADLETRLQGLREPALTRAGTISVVVPSYRDDPAVLERCLQGWLARQVSEVVVVVGRGDRDTSERLADHDDPRLRVVVTKRRSRSPLGAGIRVATGEMLVLTDADTRWQPGLLAAVTAPAPDPGQVVTPWRRVAARRRDWPRRLEVLARDGALAARRRASDGWSSGRVRARMHPAVRIVLLAGALAAAVLAGSVGGARADPGPANGPEAHHHGSAADGCGDVHDVSGGEGNS